MMLRRWSFSETAEWAVGAMLALAIIVIMLV
jgi:hypothetical protein